MISNDLSTHLQTTHTYTDTSGAQQTIEKKSDNVGLNNFKPHLWCQKSELFPCVHSSWVYACVGGYYLSCINCLPQCFEEIILVSLLHPGTYWRTLNHSCQTCFLFREQISPNWFQLDQTIKIKTQWSIYNNKHFSNDVQDIHFLTNYIEKVSNSWFQSSF